jgi:hypothetical protein
MVVGAGHRARQHGDRPLRPVPWDAVMTTMARPAVGDEVVLVSHGGRRAWVRVTKIGRKYFYVEPLHPKDSWMCRDVRLDIETGQADGGRGFRVVSQAWLNDEARRKQLEDRLHDLGVDLRYGRGIRARITTDQLAEILAIVEAAMS